MKKILIGLDDNKFAEYATEYGFNLAHQLKAEVGLVHIIEPVVTPITNTAVDPGMAMPVDSGSEVMALELMHIQDERARNMIAATIKKYGEGMQITNFTEYGDTADGIINCSKDFKADLIVIGTHSRSGIDRFLMGSVAEHVVRHSEIPVLVVPMKHEE
jgi:nucleotide-binding universal stress UspA family protein